MTPISVTVERRELRLALSGPAGSNTVLTLEVDGKSYPAVVKEMQRHPIKRTVSHIDFLQVNMNEEITVSVPVHIEGEAKAVAAEGGLVDAGRHHRGHAPRTTCRTRSRSTSPTCSSATSSVSPTCRCRGVTATGDPEMPVVTVLITSAAAKPLPTRPRRGRRGRRGRRRRVIR
jgi:large subunit ribosomal protein L25